MKENDMLVQHYLFFHGDCEEALAFYKKALAAEITMLMRYNESPEPPPPGMVPPGWEKKVMHASVVNARSAAATSATVSDREKPWKLDGSEHPSDAITVVSPMRTLACITLYSQPGGTMPGGGGTGLSL